MPQDYNSTVNLPKTDFPMRAGLAKREPDMLRDFQARELYKNLMARNEGKPLFVLHDGPPFSNGDIHIGHAVNKLLKDFIVRYKNMSGFKSPYVPGWDNHGMPIESAIIKKNKLDRKKMSIPEFRSACHDFASNFVERQREQFKRLGILGDWGNPYLTMAPEFEAEEVRVFGAMYEKGYIYKGQKPVYWCPTDETALAEAEIEYADEPCTAIYVKFKAHGMNDTYFVIWTTTTWTLPGNLAVCLNPGIEYAFVKAGGETYIIADALVDAVCQKTGLPEYEIVDRKSGRELELMTARHPLYDRDSLIIVGDHVTTEAGTGCVHTAPGFGVDDFNVCRKYPQIPMLVPVDNRGIMNEQAGKYAGLHYSKATDVILGDLEASGALLGKEHITHSYPHCWRCKNPIIFRATEQWFASVDAIKDAAAASCDDIAWIPAWGHDRMVAMIRERSDWCISRQRHWGLPIPVFYCETCKKPVCTSESVEAAARLFAEKSSNAWFDADACDILPSGFACPHCGGVHFTKETDTLDGWFDSGSTHAAVLEKFAGLRSPADIYLEGGDQYRGWFQSSMLTSVATRGRAPYRRIITHGWAVDGEGRAMHKSLGNAISPDEVVNTYGADILRLWVSSSDYTSDVRISQDILKQLSDIYLKIRNTARYILGNLDGFDPNALLPLPKMEELDRWALMRLNKLVESVRRAYEEYEYHSICHGIHNFCAVDLSNFYLDVIKDRLYCDGVDSKSGRSARTAIYLILDSLVRLLAPILAFTAEEIWSALPHHGGACRDSVLFNDMPQPKAEYEFTKEAADKWESLLSLRREINLALERARAEKRIGKPLEAEVTIVAPAAWVAANKSALAYPGLAQLCVVSGVSVAAAESVELKITVEPSSGMKCPRCWTYSHNADENGLCPRCKKTLEI
ncbi:MAG: isoleucine--tRNA ligase [Oscillospiraceae bacterium]|jgi:isoleucyl-tRNA synthetase|nr:isoleucine--tRNA ligase [Oscillospiraceae bacterium]